jgi:hypothetical protein
VGGIDVSHAGGVPLQVTPLLGSANCGGPDNSFCGTSVFYSVNLTAMTLGSGSATVDTGLTEQLAQGTPLDTGTSFFFVPTPVEDNALAALDSNAGFKSLFPGQNLEATGCVTASSSVTAVDIDEALPPLNMTFGSGAAAITLTSPALASYLYDAGSLGSGEQYCLAMFGGGDAGSAADCVPGIDPPGVTCGGMILGDMFLRNFVTELDLVHGTAGFAPTTTCPAPDAAHPMAKLTKSTRHDPRERGRGPARLREQERQAWTRRLQLH